MAVTKTHAQQTNAPLRFCIISSCPVNWAGSEELWAGAAKSLLSAGHAVTILKTQVNGNLPQIQKLQALGCPVHDLLRVRLAPLTRLFNLVAPESRQVHHKHAQLLYTALHLKTRRPDLVVISQGDNREGLPFARLCRQLHIPYAIITQKVSDFEWPHDHRRRAMQEAFRDARKCFFVSHHNQRATEEQINLLLTNACVVSNPCVVPDEGVLPWPIREEGHFYLACVARLFFKDKGQDILLQVLSQEKWKSRNLHVSFFGEGTNREGLLWLAAQKQISNVAVPGMVSDVVGIWRTHHALILPSRNEGLPLALVEAMMCGRPAIATDVGGNAEVIEDGITGFVAAPSVRELDLALERAWQRRNEWSKMGQCAAKRIRELVPPDACARCADELIRVAQYKTQQTV